MSHDIKLPERYQFAGKPAIDLSPERQQQLARFHEFASRNLLKQKITCPCGHDNSYGISHVDRVGYPFSLSLCRSCGMVFATEYWTEDSVTIFYRDWYRKCYSGNAEEDPASLFKGQSSHSVGLYKTLAPFFEKAPKELRIADVGGGAGGYLVEFQKTGAECTVADFNENFLAYGRERGLHTVSGGLNVLVDSGFTFDVVILSHIIEHFVDLNKGLESLSKIMKPGALVYVAVPGLDSLKMGRRDYDFLKDIQDAHVYYFTSQTLAIAMARYGFVALMLDKEINAVFRYTGKRENHSEESSYRYTAKSIKSAELKRLMLYPIKKRIKRMIGRNV